MEISLLMIKVLASDASKIRELTKADYETISSFQDKRDTHFPGRD